MRDKIFSIIIASICFCHLKAQSDSTFTLCGKGQKWPYYHPELRHRGGFREIKNHFRQNFSDETFKSKINNSGNITVHFDVNCYGKSGNFKTETCDNNYKPNTMDSELVSTFLDLTKALNGWYPAIGEAGEAVNSHKFFTFKLTNGALIDILPK
jgi:hypothetical protein